jgi:hypothetical protein
LVTEKEKERLVSAANDPDFKVLARAWSAATMFGMPVVLNRVANARFNFGGLRATGLAEAPSKSAEMTKEGKAVELNISTIVDSDN